MPKTVRISHPKLGINVPEIIKQQSSLAVLADFMTRLERNPDISPKTLKRCRKAAKTREDQLILENFRGKARL